MESSSSRRGFLRVATTLIVGVALVGAATPAKAQVPPIDIGNGIVITDVDLEGVAYDAATGILSATGGTVSGTIAGLPFTTDIEDFQIQLMPGMEEEGCSVLDLSLAPINLALLGLHVDTSPICLSITAFPGEGLLGDLLCGLAGGDLDLLGGLPGLLTQVLGGSLAQAEPPTPNQAGAEDICSGDCEVLDLALGPVDLTLLGLNVHLDDCEDGPVQVCVSATASEGLLGGLLCGLAGGGGLLGGLDQIADLVNTVLDALGGQTPNLRQSRQLANRLTGQLSDRLADGVLSADDLDKVTKTITQTLR